MSEQSLTLALNGEVPLGDFAAAIQSFNELVRALTHELAADKDVHWIVDRLEVGSAVAGVRGFSNDTAVRERIVRAYSSVGHALEQGQEIPYSAKVVKPARRIAELINGHITSVRFETPLEDVYVSAPTIGAPKAAPYPAAA